MTINIKNPPPTPPTVELMKNSVSKDTVSVSASDMSKIIAEAVAEALKVAIPAAAVGINAANAQVASQTREMVIRESIRRTKRCPICALPETACGGPWKKDAEGKDIVKQKADGSADYDHKLNHEMAYVGPADVNLFRWFQGMIVNGVRFLSDYPGHKIWIPKKSDIITSVNYWEQDQKELLTKRSAAGEGAGSVGPGGAQPKNTRAIGWR